MALAPALCATLQHHWHQLCLCFAGQQPGCCCLLSFLPYGIHRPRSGPASHPEQVSGMPKHTLSSKLHTSPHAHLCNLAALLYAYQIELAYLPIAAGHVANRFVQRLGGLMVHASDQYHPEHLLWVWHSVQHNVTSLPTVTLGLSQSNLTCLYGIFLW